MPTILTGKVLHICGGYPRTKLYGQLARNLDCLGVRSDYYIPVRSRADVDRNAVPDLKQGNEVYRNVIRPVHRLLFPLKIRMLKASVKASIALDKVAVTHAHTLFSDGAVAEALHQEFGIPYLAAVRNTDLNYFFAKYSPVRGTGIRVLKNAKLVVFLCPKYLERLKGIVSEELYHEVAQKAVFIPNGINEKWLENRPKTGRELGDKLRFLYIGDLTANKNIGMSISVIRQLRLQGFDARFDVVGSGGDPLGQRVRLMEENKEFVTYHGRVEDIEELLRIVRHSDVFIMPSFHETFGLVYCEAMSQGLPVLYSRGEGIDGIFEDSTVGCAVQPTEFDDVRRGALTIIKNYERMSSRCLEEVSRFDWRQIAMEYRDWYEKIGSK